jgi:transcriptional regulator with XRE-family HTH domain
MAHTLGHRIRTARKHAGFKNAELLAVRLGVGHRTVQRWESGDSEPSVARLREIAAVTEHPLGWFLNSEETA